MSDPAPLPLKGSFTYRVDASEAMTWELRGDSLAWALVDQAAAAAHAKYGAAFEEVDVDTRITAEYDVFIVTFTWDEEGNE